MFNPEAELQLKVLQERLSAVYYAISRNVRDAEVSAILKDDALKIEEEIEALNLEMMGIQRDDAMQQISTALQSSREGIFFEAPSHPISQPTSQPIPEAKL